MYLALFRVFYVRFRLCLFFGTFYVRFLLYLLRSTRYLVLFGIFCPPLFYLLNQHSNPTNSSIYFILFPNLIINLALQKSSIYARFPPV